MKKLRIGQIGLGRLGSLHALNLVQKIPHAELATVCSLNDQELNWAVAELGLDKSCCYSDYQQMLSEGGLDAVVIASSSDQHCNHVLLALEAGLHVFCEKPLGTQLKDCLEVEKALDRHPGKVLMIGFMRRFDPSYTYAKNKIQEGYIGKPILFRSYSLDPDKDIQEFLQYLPNSAGQFLDMAIHDIDLARWMLESEPETIYAAGGSYAYPEFDNYQDGDNVGALLQFENKSMAFLLAGRTAPHGYHIETEIIGTKATIRIGSVPSGNMVELVDNGGIRQECFQNFKERFRNAFELEMKEFIDCIIYNRKSPSSAYDATRATAIALAATDSFRENKLIKLKSNRERKVSV